MRTIILGALLGAISLQPPVTGQERPVQTGPPEKGATITVKGCVAGGSALHDEATGVTYRLKGKKDVLKRLGDEHKGHIDEITGVLRTDMKMGGTKSKRIGNTTISIGAAESMGMSSAPRELHPVLEVTSIEHLPLLCVK